MGCSTSPIRVALFVVWVACLSAKGIPPSILVQPDGQIVGNGETVRFSVVAEGDPPPSYQWRFNGNQISNATNASLILSHVEPFQAGYYSVVVFNPTGTNVSNDAFLEVCWEIQLVSFEQVPSLTNAPYATRLKFDSEGNLYLVPYLEGRPGFSLLKLTPSRQQAWEIRPIPETGIGYLALSDFTIDSMGNVYLVGVAATNYYTDREEIIVWKFDRDGAELWLNRHQSGGYAHGIAVDSAGNVLVVGTTSEGINSHGVNKPPGEIELNKFSPAGQRLWTVIYDGPGDDTPDPGPLAVDASGNAYFALTAYRSGDPSFAQDLVIAKYDQAGTKQWTARRPVNQMYPPDSLLVDRDSNLVVGLSFWHGAPLDSHETVKFDTNGNLLWEIRHTEDSEIEVAGTRALDEFNDVCFALIRFFDHKLILSKYDPDGELLWSVEHDPPEQWSFYQNGALRVGLDQNVSFAGYLGEWAPTTLNVVTFRQNTTKGRPTIHGEQPRTRRMASGATVHFDVTATGLAPLHYQWRRDGLSLPGATNANLGLTNVTPSDSGGYSVLVTNAAGCSISSEGRLTVVDVPPFLFGQFRDTSNTVTFTLTGEADRLYWIEASTNLVDWSSLFGYGGGSSIISKGNYPSRFFRARTDP